MIGLSLHTLVDSPPLTNAPGVRTNIFSLHNNQFHPQSNPRCILPWMWASCHGHTCNLSPSCRAPSFHCHHDELPYCSCGILCRKGAQRGMHFVRSDACTDLGNPIHNCSHKTTRTSFIHIRPLDPVDSFCTLLSSPDLILHCIHAFHLLLWLTFPFPPRWAKELLPIDWLLVSWLEGSHGQSCIPVSTLVELQLVSGFQWLTEEN